MNREAQYDLASQAPGNDLQNLSLPNPEATPAWLVPTETKALDFYANASVPVGLDTEWSAGFLGGDPETFSGSQGNSAHVHVAASPSVSNGNWVGDVGEPGPFTGPAPTGHVAVNLLATTSAFDFDADSSTGDYWFTSLIPAQGPASANATGAAALGSRGKFLTALQRQARTTPVRARERRRRPPAGPDQWSSIRASPVRSRSRSRPVPRTARRCADT